MLSVVELNIILSCLNMMGDFLMIANDVILKQPSSAELHVSKPQLTTVYLYCNDELFHAFGQTEHSDGRNSSCAWWSCAYLAPSSIISIFSAMSLDYCLCQNGIIYRIPVCVSATECERTENETSKEDVFMDEPFGLSHLQKNKSLWQTVHIQDCHKIFSDEKCRLVFPFGRDRKFIGHLLEDHPHWWLKVYEVSISTSGIHEFQQMVAIPLPCSKRMRSCPVMTAFRTGESSNDDTLSAVLLSSVLGREVSSLSKWAILVTLGDGEVYSVPFNEEQSCEKIILPLFCLHQPVVTIQKVTFGSDVRRQDGIVCIGSLGKVIMVVQSSSSNVSVSHIETHIPGPVKCWSSLCGLALHTDGSCLWRTVFQHCQMNSDISAPPLVTSRMKLRNLVTVEVCRNQGSEGYSNVFFYTSDGRLLLLPKLDIANVPDLPTCSASLFKTMALKTLLNKIHECAEHLAQINNAEEDRRKLLKEMASAAHLFFNEKVKKTLNICATSEWVCSEPHNVSVSVKLFNSGSFVVLGNHWYFVVSICTVDGQHITKSTPVIGGLYPGNSIIVILKVHLGDIITENKFPLSMACGLQFLIDMADEKVESFLHDVQPVCCSNQPPLTFHVNLWNGSMDELHFLHLSESHLFPCFETTIDAALVELARSRPASTLHDIESIIQPVNKLLKSSFTSIIKINYNYVEHLLKGQTSFENSSVAVQLLEYITQPSRVPVNHDMENPVVEFALFGQKVKLEISENGLHLNVVIFVSCPYLLPKLKSAVLRKLRLLNDENVISTCKRSLIEGFPILQSSVVKCVALKSLINQSLLLPAEKFSYLINHIYKEMRDHVSAELPFI